MGTKHRIKKTEKKIKGTTVGDESQERVNQIPVDLAYLHGIFSTLKNMAAGIYHFKLWTGAQVATNPQKIFDIDGTLLFFDFDVKRGKQVLGTIRTAANKMVGTAVLSFHLGPKLWDEKTGRKKIAEIIKKKFSGYVTKNQLLVCYSYPKIGLMVTIENKNNETKTLIFDIADYSLIPIQSKDNKYEGAYAWSYLGEMEEKKKKANISKFDERTKSIQKIFKDFRLTSKIRQREINKIFDISKLKFKINIVKELQFCTHYNYNEPASHHCFVLHAQQVNDYCAVATCQMILCYYRYFYSQDDIAPALGYSSGSGCPFDQSPGYESLSNNHIDSSYDTSPTWEKARDQIRLLQPLKSGIPGHARACAGYSYILEIFTGISDKQLYIYDPWPWNSDLKAGGAIYWEDWDSYTSYIRLKSIAAGLP